MFLYLLFIIIIGIFTRMYVRTQTEHSIRKYRIFLYKRKNLKLMECWVDGIDEIDEMNSVCKWNWFVIKKKLTTTMKRMQFGAWCGWFVRVEKLYTGDVKTCMLSHHIWPANFIEQFRCYTTSPATKWTNRDWVEGHWQTIYIRIKLKNEIFLIIRELVDDFGNFCKLKKKIHSEI